MKSKPFNQYDNLSTFLGVQLTGPPLCLFSVADWLTSISPSYCFVLYSIKGTIGTEGVVVKKGLVVAILTQRFQIGRCILERFTNGFHTVGKWVIKSTIKASMLKWILQAIEETDMFYINITDWFFFFENAIFIRT